MIDKTKVKKEWEEFKNLKEQFPNAHIFKNIENMNEDMESLINKSPYLFDIFRRIFASAPKDDSVTLWNNYKEAYYYLETNNLLNFQDLRPQLVERTIKHFIQKVDGPLLVPLKSIESLVCEEKSIVTIDFYDYMSLLEEYYHFSHNDFFQTFEMEEEEDLYLSSLLGLSLEDFNNYSNIKPVDNIIAARVNVLDDFYRDFNKKPFLDYKLYLAEHDFKIDQQKENKIFNSINNWGQASDVIEEDIKISGKLFDAFRKLLFKELYQHVYFKEQSPNEIIFSFY